MFNSFATTWTVAHQVLLSMGFPRVEYWSELPFPSPGDLPDPEIKPASPSLAGGFFTDGVVMDYYSAIKEGNPTIYNMNGPWGHGAGWNKSER